VSGEPWWASALIPVGSVVLGTVLGGWYTSRERSKEREERRQRSERKSAKRILNVVDLYMYLALDQQREGMIDVGNVLGPWSEMDLVGSKQARNATDRLVKAFHACAEEINEMGGHSEQVSLDARTEFYDAREHFIETLHGSKGIGELFSRVSQKPSRPEDGTGNK
jgi:hypothetical protein